MLKGRKAVTVETMKAVDILGSTFQPFSIPALFL